MRKAALTLVSTVAALVMLLSFKTHAAAPVTTPPAAVSTTGATSAAGSSAATSSSTAKSSSSSSKTLTGTAVDTRYGPVQVRITVTNGKITAASAVDYPQSNPRDAQINAYAVPRLNAEAQAAGTANIDVVAGATYTSDGYIQSLQSALDKA